MPQTLRFAIRARWIDGNVYVRKADLLKWFDDEAEALDSEGLEERAFQVTSLAEALRKVRAS